MTAETRFSPPSAPPRLRVNRPSVSYQQLSVSLRKSTQSKRRAHVLVLSSRELPGRPGRRRRHLSSRRPLVLPALQKAVDPVDGHSGREDEGRLRRDALPLSDGISVRTAHLVRRGHHHQSLPAVRAVARRFRRHSRLGRLRGAVEFRHGDFLDDQEAAVAHQLNLQLGLLRGRGDDVQRRAAKGRAAAERSARGDAWEERSAFHRASVGVPRDHLLPAG